MVKLNKFYKITKPENVIVFTNDPKEIAAAQKDGLRVDDIGILSEDEISRYRSRGIEIIDLVDKPKPAKPKTKPKLKEAKK